MSRIKKMLSKIFFYRGFSRRNKMASVLFVVILIIFSSLYIYNAMKPQSTEAAWFNDNWGYRQAITVTVSSSASDITDLETLITVDTTGITSKVRTNCEDLRFTNAGGKVLPYYIDSCTNNSATNKIWVLADLVPKNTTTYTIYMYYGNSSANSASDTTRFNLFRGLVGYFTNNDGTGGNSTDTSKTAANGTLNIGGSGTQTTTAQAWSNGSSGKYSGSLNFDGTDDRVNVSSSAYALTNAVTLSAWIYPTTSSGSRNILSNGNPWDYRLYQSSLNLGMQVSLDNGNTGYHTASNVLTANTWQHVVGVFDGSRKKMYVNGVKVLDVSHSGTIQTPASSLVMASYGTGEYFQGQIDDARVYNRGLSEAEVLALYQNPGKIATTAPTTSKPTTAFATEEKSPAPVAYWKFDEGYGTSAKDSTTNRSNGTISGATWQTEDKCISTKCLFLTSTNNVNIADPSNGSLDFGTGDFTVSSWIRTASTADNRNLIYKGAGDGTYGWRFGITSGRVHVLLGDSTGGVEGTIAPASMSIADNKWHHVTVVYNRSGNAVAYIDGVPTGTTLTISSKSGTINNSSAVIITANTYGGFSGFIDEPKIYNYARTAAQVKADYAARGTSKGSAATLSAVEGSNLSNGLVGYWKMDESSGAGSTLADSSGNSNTGTASLWGGGNTATDSAHVVGKFGNSFSFDGVDDYIDIGTPLGTSAKTRTYAIWVKPTAGSSSSRDGIIGENAASRIDYGNGVGTSSFHALVLFTGGTYAELTGTGLGTNNWSHLALSIDNEKGVINFYVNGALTSTQTWDTNTKSVSNSTTHYIGRVNSASKFPGSMDDVRIYNRALSGAEVSQLYNFAPGPVGYWNFEEGQGTAVNDTSGNGYSGTLTNSPTRTTGKYGKGLQFSQTTSQQSSAAVSSGALSYLNDHTLGFWVKFTDPAASDWRHVVGYRITSGNDRAPAVWTCPSGTSTLGLYWRFGPSNVGFNCWGPTGASSVFSTNTWYYMTVTKSGTTATYYVNGIQYGTATVDATMSNGVGTFNMGYNGSYQAAGVLLDEVKVYNYARTAKQIVSDMNAGHPNVGSPVGSALGHWKFDEGYGTTTGNSGSGGSIITGSLSGGATWTRDGKFGKAIVTNGTNTYASIPDNDTIDFTYSQDFAVSFWLKDGGGNATDDSVVEKWAGVGGYPYVFRYNNGGSISFKRYDGTNNPSVTGTKIVNDGAWHYIVGVKSGSTLYLYIDNAPVKTGTDTTTGTTTNSSAVYLGERGNGSQYWNGAIDEVKIYNFALTADEIKLDMNRGASQVLGSLSDTSGLTGGSVASNSASAEYCIPGDTATCSAPVGRWDFEEGNGGTVNDISGNSLTGTMTNNATWSSGKLGKAGNFNGASVRQGVQISSNALLNPGTGSFTTEAWIRTSQTGTVKRIVTKRGSSGTWYSMFIQNGKLDFETSVSYPTYYSSTAGNRTINDGKWHHVVMVRDTGQSKVLLYVDGILDINPTDNTAGQSITNSEIFEIGIWGSETYDTGSYTGKIDQVKTYNYARTPSQIAYDYNKGAPIAHWKMDECQGGTANDSSGNNNNGTITIGGSGTQTSAGTCTTASTAWGNGATGKYNASLNFDGNDDYITVAHTSQLIPTGEITLSAWVKTSSTIATIISKTDTSTPWNGYIINIGDSGGNDGKLCYWPGNYPTYSWTCTTSRTVNDSSWHHVLITHSGTTASYYIDGKFVESKTVGSRTTTSTQNLLIGEENATTTRGFNGQMDDVRIYNYALTVSQIKQLMNQGSAVRFGPSTGTP